MPLKKVNVIVEGLLNVPPEADAHPEHPIYIPIVPPPDSGLHPEHPIYIPVEPPGIWPPGSGIDMPDNTLPGDQPRPDHTLPGDLPHAEHPIYLPITPPPDSGLHPEHPIYIPVYPAHPIELPPDSGSGGLFPPLTEEQKEKLRAFLEGNLPPFTGAPEIPTPVRGR